MKFKCLIAGGASAIALSLAGCATVPGAAVEAGAISAAPSPAQAEESVPASGETAWGIPVYDVVPDSTVQFGVLDNGMRYAILRNETPQGTASIRLGFDVGWLDQDESEYGVAHFIEHMAFNGTTNIAEGELVALLEREGLAFGADTNASTSFEDTIYQLDLPNTEPELLGTALMIMRETASEQLLAPGAIDRERGILLSEIRTRNNFAQRNLRDLLRFLTPEGRPATHFSNEAEAENLRTVTTERLRAFYERFYRPDNATLVIVGDVDPAAVERMVEARFSDWKRPAASLPQADYGRVNFDRGLATNVFVDPGIDYGITISRLKPFTDDLPTLDKTREEFVGIVATLVMNRRFQTIAQRPGAPIRGGSAGLADLFEMVQTDEISIAAKEGEWAEALAVAEQEVRRAVQFGFTDAEVAEQLAVIETVFRTQAEQSGTRRNNALADQILATSRTDDLFVSPDTIYAIFQQIRDDLTTAEVNRRFREKFSGDNVLIHVTSKEPVAGGEAAVAAAYRGSGEIAVSAPEIVEDKAFAYEDFGTPGTVIVDETIADLGIRTIRFANNVRLNLKTTDFEKGGLRFAIRVGTGELTTGRELPGVALALNSTSALGATGEHGLDELSRILAGEQVSYGFTMSTDRIGASGATTMTDFARQMQVSAGYLTDPGYREEAFAQYRAGIPSFYAGLGSTPQGVAQRDVERIYAGGDPRFGLPQLEEASAINAEMLRRAIASQLENGAIEIGVVGDIDEEAVIAAVAQTFGALPARAVTPGIPAEAVAAQFTSDFTPRTRYHQGAPDQGLVKVAWPTTSQDDLQLEATLDILTEAMAIGLRDEIREKLGATYSPSANSFMSSIFPGYGFIEASIIVAPEQRDEVFDAVDRIAADLAANDIGDTMLQQARQPLLERSDRLHRENGYWLTYVDDAQFQADRLDRIRRYGDALRSVTPAMVREAARRYLGSNPSLRVAIVHQSLRPE